MRGWENLYSILKMTRGGSDNQVITDLRLRKYIASSITKKDIEKMKAEDVKEAVINYLTVLIPEIR
jgi:hypothetical protein